jgi:vancomycin resistance protein YoaR
MSNNKKIALFFIGVALVLFATSFSSMIKVNSMIRKDIDKIQINSYVGDYEISNIRKDNVDKILDEIEIDLTSQRILLSINGDDYTYKMSDMGIGIKKDKLKNEIFESEDSKDYWERYYSYSKNEFDKKTYDYEYIVNQDKLTKFLNDISKDVNKNASKGKLKMDSKRNLKYVDEQKGFELDIEGSKEIIVKNFELGNFNKRIELVGKEIEVEDKLKLIDTKISSFTTEFDDTIVRKFNLIAGASYIDGKILKPNEVFSFYDNAGPYNKEGYVYYNGMMGNGVCQVATTLYNAELLAGLTTVTRYNHGIKSVYVDGGLDATVAVTGGAITDFKFKNTLKYPVYISAFVKGGKLTVEMWSTKDAKNGIEYKTESKKLGYGAYNAYRKAYKNGKLIKTEDLGISYYFSE